MSLNFWNDGGVTRLRILRQDVPWRAIRAFTNSQSEALVHLHNVSGGVLGGDDLRLSVHLQPSAKAQLTSTGATRLYRRKTNGPHASQQVNIHLEPGAFLEYVPDAIIPFAGSHYGQSTAINLEHNAGLIWWEMLSGTFAFHEFTSEFAITTPSQPVAMERFCLRPREQDLASLSRLGPYSYTATLYACHVDHDQHRWTKLERHLSVIADELSTPDIRWGASTLVRDGVVVRALSREAHLLVPGLHRFWAEAKMAIWNSTACLPRKIH